MRWSASPSHTGHRTAPSDIAFAGESAGGGLAIATLVNARDHGLPLPAAAFVMSPYADLTLAGTAMETKREVDPLMSREALQSRVTDYTAGQDAALGLVSPIFADLSGLPPLIIQAGTHEVLLDDAVRPASCHRRRRGHPRHHPPGAARLPNLLSDPRRSGRVVDADIDLRSGIDGGRLETGRRHGHRHIEQHPRETGGERNAGAYSNHTPPRQSPTLHGSFYRSAICPLLSRINAYLVRWIRHKYKRLRAKKKAFACWGGIVKRFPAMFAHWAWIPSVPAVW